MLNGAARPFFGWVSDHIGRENTMAIAFGLGGIAYWLLGTAGTSPWAFVIFAGLIFLTWGEIFSLFPSTCTDTFGPKYATANAEPALHGQGHVGLPGAAGQRASRTRPEAGTRCSSSPAIMNFVVVALALFVLKPLRARISRRRGADAARGRITARRLTRYRAGLGPAHFFGR